MTPTRALRTFGMILLSAFIVTGIGMKPVLAMGTDNPPPTDDGKKKKKGSAIDAREHQLAYQEFLRGYRAARARILAGDYQGGIAALHALGNDAHPDVANYIGYAYRRMGDYDDAKTWYEKALAADPDHVRTWSYYGMWQMEQGNRLKALDDLAKVKLICGNASCEEYRQLKAVIDGKASY